MDVIELTRQLGHALQADERYLKMDEARKNSDADEKLQELIGQFNLKRLALNNEASAEKPDNEKVQKMNQELRSIYAQVMQNPNMIAYNEAKQGVDELLQRISAIISQSADGEDQDTADYVPSCGGDCSGCGGSCGCH